MANVAAAQRFGEMPLLGPGLSPRHFLGSAPVVRRQTGTCGTGFHHCEDIGFSSTCCADDHYCYVNPQGQPSCCAVENTCDNLCPISQFLCNATTTVTGKATTTSGCCQRPCSAYSAYKCASSYGGNCCALGYSCATSSCLSTSIAPTTLVSIVPSGCTTGQFSCASSIGGGCCDNGAVCTQSDTTLLCASGTSAPSAIRTGPDGSLVSGITQTAPNTGLSTGAKAGIGIGIALVACLIIAGVLWFCIRSRKAARQAQTNSQQSDSVSGGPTQGMAQTPRGPRRVGLTDYFGPTATTGPYTEHESTGNTPFTGVPISPDNPSDIVPAVEIGHSREHSNVTSPGDIGEANLAYSKPNPETMEHRAELA